MYDERHPVRVTLTWTNYVSGTVPSDAIFILNGSVVGQGAEGFERVLDTIRQLPRHSEVVVFPDSDLIPSEPVGPSAELTVVPSAVPFREDSDQYLRIIDVWEQMEAVVTFCYPYPEKAEWTSVWKFPEGHSGRSASN